MVLLLRSNECGAVMDDNRRKSRGENCGMPLVDGEIAAIRQVERRSLADDECKNLPWSTGMHICTCTHKHTEICTWPQTQKTVAQVVQLLDGQDGASIHVDE